jgi:hypothetical protein
MRLTDEIIQSYIFANTPGFLYDGMKKSEFTSTLLAENSIEDLIRKFQCLCQNQERTLEETILAYAILVAFTKIIDYQKASKIIRNLDLSNLQWGGHICTIFETRTIPTTATSGKINPPLDLVKKNLSDIDHTFFPEKLKLQPKVNFPSEVSNANYSFYERTTGK